MLQLYQSNRLEILADRLAQVLATPQDDPFAPETVVVQHQGMGRWLSLRLADRLGVCANMRFPMPAGFIWEMLEGLLDDVPEQNHFAPQALPWAVYQHLDMLKGEDGFDGIRTYYEHNGEVERFQLSQQIAGCLDQYLVYRPQWVSTWERGQQAVEGDEWQAQLWRSISRRCGGEHWVSLQKRLFNKAQQGGLNSEGLPSRIALFGVSSLSPGYLNLLGLLGELTEAHLFLLNPCQEHWGEIVSESDRLKQESDESEEAFYFDVGNPLLGSLGKQGRDFFNMILELDPGSEDLFVPPTGNNLLHGVQQDILYLQDAGDLPPGVWRKDDDSISVHACHSPMREVEVLRDRLLDLFQRHPDLTPSDVLVMTPDMDTYAPYVESVFSESGDGARIPFSIADRSAVSELPLLEVFLRLLEMPGGRYDVNSMLALLEVRAVAARFGLADGDLPMITEWLEQAEVRWGKDAGTRKALGLPETGQNSWQAGLDRMLLGYAMPPEDALFQDVLPFDGIEGSNAQVLGGLKAFADEVFRLESLLKGARTLEQWAQSIPMLLERFFLATEEEEYQLQSIRTAVAEIVESTATAEFDGRVTIDLLGYLLRERFETGGGHSPFLGGGVTFCALTPMRSLPFEVVCIIGMNDGQYPRDRRPPGFDLMSGRHRIGDRSRRADDRYLFLESLVSARQVLYLSFVGQDIRDNSPIPPSVLLSELLDYIDRTHRDEAGELPSRTLLVKHPIQPFSPRYFQSGSDLFSYSELMCRAAGVVSDSVPIRHLVSEALPEPEDEWRRVELAELLYFYANPSRYLLRNRLGITLRADESLLETRDPFELAYFQQSELMHGMVERALEGESAEALLGLEQAAGQLPHGVYGEQLFERLNAQSRRFAEGVATYQADGETVTLELDFSHDSVRLMGKISDVGPSGRFGYSVNRLPDSRLLQLWVEHLALNLAAEGGITPQTLWLDSEELIRFAPIDNAPELMGQLLSLYWQGLSMPLRLFPKSSRRYAEKLQKGNELEKCLEEAQRRWCGKHFPEFDDAYYRLAFPDADVLSGEFMALSEQVFGTLLAHMEVQ
ncbi:exodeoxyribonuclease V subunit gamma [Solemya velesiana gill symbiont]|nr:exodeoxyribonuclease V subunit gamma [Solemya velesiana gill symbiont]